MGSRHSWFAHSHLKTFRDFPMLSQPTWYASADVFAAWSFKSRERSAEMKTAILTVCLWWLKKESQNGRHRLL